MSKLTTKDVTVIAALSAIVAVSSYLMIMQFVFIVITRCVKRTHAYLVAIVSSLATYIFWGFAYNTLLNFIILPLIAFLIYQADHYIEKNPAKNENTNLALVSFFVILGTGFINLLFIGFIQGNIWSALLAYTYSNILYATINTLLIYFLAQPTKKTLLRLINQ